MPACDLCGKMPAYRCRRVVRSGAPIYAGKKFESRFCEACVDIWVARVCIDNTSYYQLSWNERHQPVLPVGFLEVPA